jgi:hypothetical protein
VILKKFQEGGGCFSRHSPVEKKILEKILELSTEVSSFSNQCDIYIIELTSETCQKMINNQLRNISE